MKLHFYVSGILYHSKGISYFFTDGMSKLKRQRKKKDPIPNLNDSDDFISTTSTRLSRTRSQHDADSSKSITEPIIKPASISSTVSLPQPSTSVPCPLCRKAVSDEAGHLKVSPRYTLKQDRKIVTSSGPRYAGRGWA